MNQKSWMYYLLRWPVRLLTRFKAIKDDHSTRPSAPDHLVYVMRAPATSDLIVAREAALELGLPDPMRPLELNGRSYPRVLYVEDPLGRLHYDPREPFTDLLRLHQQQGGYNVVMYPVGLFWGREPGSEAGNGTARTMTADIEVPGKWKRFLLVLFSGRNILARFSQPVSLRTMADSHGNDQRLAHKLTRVARTHFARLRYAVAGPKLADREDMIQHLMATPAMRKAIGEEVRSRKVTEDKANQRAHKYLDEISADYREGLVRFGDRFFTWLWTRLYNGIEVKNGETIRSLAQDGHEIVYVPCHRSHMDYLLLSYVIYKEGLVPPHIAAGVNLNFFPVGTIFRRGGAFFIRRSFRGNKLYSTAFREYLTYLFQKGYAIEYYMEGGRSRTGRLLNPKTGMVAMTIQGQLRGVTRPITLVPVYVGYEHVMEVNTYHNELKGQKKEKESVFQIFKMLRKLRNFGHGYVTFGEPLRLSDYLDKAQPDWRESVTTGSQEPAKPRWLTPRVNQLAELMMRRINDGAALNSINLAAAVLLASEQHSQSKEELLTQMHYYVRLLRSVPYSNYAQVPDWDTESMWQNALRMNKFTITEDAAGTVVKLAEKDAVTLTYYRNNILHMLIIPSLVARYCRGHQQVKRSHLVAFMEQVFPLLQAELFLSHETADIGFWVDALCAEFAAFGWLAETSQGYALPNRDSAGYVQLTLLANISEETVARYAVVLELLQQSTELSRSDLEGHSQLLARRLSARHGIEAPEFYDKRLFGNLVGVLKHSGYIAVLDDGTYTSDERTDQLSDAIDYLLGSTVRRTIRQSVERLLTERQATVKEIPKPD